MKSIILAVLAALIGTAPVSSPKEDLYIPVLTYHNFANQDISRVSSKTTTTVQSFEENIDTLTKNGYTSISMEQLRDYLKSGKSLPTKPYAITMDDGYESNYTYAYPVLKRYKAKATIFIIGEPSTNALPHLKWDEIREMQSSGLVSIQNHTFHHDRATSVSTADFLDSVRKCDTLLLNNLGQQRTAKVFSYPYGANTPETRSVLVKEGYELQFVTATGLVSKNSDITKLSRITVSSYDTGEKLLKTIEALKKKSEEAKTGKS